MPVHCACGRKNGVEHSLTCKKGGYVSMRHNAIRDTEANIMKEVATDVVTEPNLLPVGNVELVYGSNTQAQALLDISARGIWSRHERVFFDVRITHPHAPSNTGKSIEALFKQNEQEKIRAYNDRVIQVEKSSFVPLVFSTNGGMSLQCKNLHSQLASLISRKRGEKYSEVMKHLRTRLRFALLKSTIIAVRGYRGNSVGANPVPLMDVDFGLVEAIDGVRTIGS